MMHLLVRDDKSLEVGAVVFGPEGSSACLEEELNNIPNFVSAGSSSVICMQWKKQMFKYFHKYSEYLTYLCKYVHVLNLHVIRMEN